MIRLVALAFIFASPAQAETPTNAEPGQLVCRDRDELRGAVQAIRFSQSKDFDDLKSCVLLQSSVKLLGLEELGHDYQIGLRVLKVRVIAPGGTFEGYTLEAKR